MLLTWRGNNMSDWQKLTPIKRSPQPGSRGLFVLDIPLACLKVPLKTYNFMVIQLETKDLLELDRLGIYLTKRTLITADDACVKRLYDEAAIDEFGIVHLVGYAGIAEIERRVDEIAGLLSKAYADYRLDPAEVSRNNPTGAFYFSLSADGTMKRQDLI